jgi:hypothetical protein
LMARVYLVGCSTEISAGVAPLRIFFNKRAVPRNASLDHAHDGSMFGESFTVSCCWLILPSMCS